MARAFPLRWPAALEFLFDVQGAVSTLGEHLINPDCVADAPSAADLFFAKQIGFALLPVIAVLLSLAFWVTFAKCKRVSFAGRWSAMSDEASSPKDMCIVTVGALLFLLFPTLCKQGFAVFSCKRVGDGIWLQADLAEPCYQGRHLAYAVLLGGAQLLVFVLGLPALMLVILIRSRASMDGNSFAVEVRYGLFFSAYKRKRFYWEAVITARKSKLKTSSTSLSAPTAPAPRVRSCSCMSLLRH